MKTILLNVRLRYENVRKAREFKEGDGKPRYSASFLVEKGSEMDKVVNAAIEDTAKEAWQDKAKQKLASMRGQKMQYCYRQYLEDEDYMKLDAHRYHFAKNGSVNGPPMVVDMLQKDLPAETGKPYPGCYVNAIVKLWAQTGENPGIRCALQTVQFKDDGDAFGDNVPTTEGLPMIESTVSADEEDEFV